VTPALIEYVDIAGLVKGASEGAGLGNQFLEAVRSVDLIVHLVRCFMDEQIIHVETSVDPIRDIQIIEDELLLKDYQLAENLKRKKPKTSGNIDTRTWQKVVDQVVDGMFP